MFGKKKEEVKEDISTFNWLDRVEKEHPLFKSIRSLIYEAEHQFNNGQLDLADDILALVARHIKRNKFSQKEGVSTEDLTNLKQE